MKQALEEAVKHIEITGISMLGVAAAIQPNEELAVIGGAIIGSALGGFVGAYFAKLKSLKQWTLRWAVNFCTGIPAGLLFTAQYKDDFSNIPATWFAMSVASIVGPAVVFIIPISIPFLKEAFVAWMEKRAKIIRQENNNQ